MPTTQGQFGLGIESFQEPKQACVRLERSITGKHDLFVPIHPQIGPTFYRKQRQQCLHLIDEGARLAADGIDMNGTWILDTPFGDVPKLDELMKTSLQTGTIDIEFIKLLYQRIVGSD